MSRIHEVVLKPDYLHGDPSVEEKVTGSLSAYQGLRAQKDLSVLGVNSMTQQEVNSS